MRIKRKLALSLALALILMLTVALPVLAIDEPDLVMQINGTTVYRNCMETGDQLYIIDYTIDYTANPAENVTEAFLIRLMNGAVELGAVAPYAYYDDGYDRGVASIYFSAADAPTWEGDYTIILTGNPALVWVPANPSVSVNPLDLWQDNAIATTQVVLSSRILWLADQLEVAWSVDMIETLGTGSALTTYGEDYFTNVFENLRLIAPYAFSGQAIQPEVEKKEFTQDYADSLVLDLVGTPLDMTALANAIGLSRAMTTGILYYVVVVVFLVLLARGMQTYKPVMLMGIPCVIGGAFLGVPLVITIVAGFIALAMIGFALFYKGATA